MNTTATPSKRWFTIVTAFVLAVALLLPAAPVQADVDPPVVDIQLQPGESFHLTKTVDVPEAPPRADVYFLADTTGSMGSAIAQVQADAATVLAELQASIADVQFGAGQYKDFPHDAFAFSNGAAIGPDDGAGGNPDASDEIAGWSASGGWDLSEGQFFALDQIADPGDPMGIGWRPGASKILVWFGDAPAHDPVCAAISGLAYDIDEASVTAKLVDAGITVVAIGTDTGLTDALDDDPTLSASDYDPPCAIGGTAGQATRIAEATGGSYAQNVSPEELADAILAGIEAIKFDVTATPVDCEPLNITFDPPVHEGIEGPATVMFEEWIEAPADAEAGVVACTVEFKANDSVIGVQKVNVKIVTEDADLKAHKHAKVFCTGYNDAPEYGSNDYGAYEKCFVRYVITVKNFGPGAPNKVYLVDSLPEGIKIISFSANKGTFDPETGIWQVGPLGARDWARLLITARLPEGAYGDGGDGDKCLYLTNTVEAFSELPDPRPDNNVASVTLKLGETCDGGAKLSATSEDVNNFLPIITQ